MKRRFLPGGCTGDIKFCFAIPAERRLELDEITQPKSDARVLQLTARRCSSPMPTAPTTRWSSHAPRRART
jgi:hypothetical protein